MKFRRDSLAILVAVLVCAFMAGPAKAATFTVNSTADASDLSPGDSSCDSNAAAGNQCTLRAAVEETNGLNDIAPFHTVNLPANTYTLTNGVLLVTWNLNLVGAGARGTIVERSTSAGADRVFDLDSADSNFSGITVRNGIADATNNFFGGNIRATSSDVVIANSLVTNGSGSSGGGISNVFGQLTVRNSTVAGNRADTGGGDAGAIQNFGNVDNIATLIVENSTLSDNSARLAGGIISGGNVQNSVTVKNSTIASNASGDRGGGGGLLIGTGTAAVENSIIAQNTSSATPLTPNCSTDVGATIGSFGFNIESGSECGLNGTGDKQNTNPLIGPLQNLGGPTDTRPLLAGSPAIDAGNNSTCFPTDQRGVSRPQGSRCDIGAFEAAVTLDTVIDTAPPSRTRDRTPTFTFSSNQPGTTFECSLNSSPFAPCTSPLSLPELPAGTHTLEIRARDAAGTVDPTPASFTFVIPAELKDLKAPVLGRLVNAEPVSGTVLVGIVGGASSSRRGGARAAQKGVKFIPLQEAKQIPVGSFFNTRRGRVRLQSATTRRGRRQAGVFSGGLFKTAQSRRRSGKGLFELRLAGSSFTGCTARRKRARGKGALAAARSKRRIRRLRGNARGRFRTRGRYSSATVRGTTWTVTDRCDGTLTQVSSGRVAVRDFRRRKTRTVRAGKRYLARAPG